jgi:hypothetical protein
VPVLTKVEGADASQTQSLATRTPAIEGTGAGANASVRIYAQEGAVLLGTVTADADGKWALSDAASFANVLKPGDYHLQAVVVDAHGNMGTPSTASAVITIAAASPMVPTILGIGSDASSSDSGRPADGQTNDSTPTLRGTAAAGGQVNLYLDGVKQNATPITADAQGFWSYALSSLASNTASHPSYTLTAKGVNGVLLSEPSSVFDLVINTAAVDAPVITTSSSTVGTATPEITGTAVAGGVVRIYDGSTLLGDTTAGSDGQWRFTPLVPLSDGVHTLKGFLPSAMELNP